MTTRREVFPLIAGAAGISAASDFARRGGGTVGARAPARFLPERAHRQTARLLRLSTAGIRAGEAWPVMLFLHGDGERGDARGELDYVLTHGPLFEAWCQRRDLPFVIISPQLDKFSRGEVPYIKDRDRAQIPQRLANWINPRPDAAGVRLPEPMQGKRADDKLPDGPEGPPDGWNEMEKRIRSRWSIARSRTSKVTRSASISPA